MLRPHPPLWRLLAALLTLCLGACAVYQPQPLADTDSLLANDALTIRLEPRAHARLAAAPVDLSLPLSELDLARIALVASPDLAALRAQSNVAEAQLIAAGLIADPQLTLALDHPTGIDVVNAVAGGVALELSSLLTRPPRLDAARASRAKARQDLAWSEWLVISQVRLLVRRVDSLQRQHTLLTQVVDAAHALLQVHRDNLQRGDARLDDVSLYQIAYLDAQGRRDTTARALTAARLQLNALVGLSPSADVHLQSSTELTPPLPIDVLGLTRRAMAERLDLEALRAGYLAQEAELRASVRLGLPLPQLAFNRARDTSAVWTKGMAVDLTLPLWNRNRGDIAVATATRTQLSAEYTARVRQVQSDIAELSAELTALASAHAALGTELPALRASADALSSASRAGTVTVISAQVVQAALLDQELALLALEQSQSETAVALETAVGAFLSEPAP